MARWQRLTIRLPQEEAILAKAYARDRRLPVAAIARSALMSEITRHVGRSHLLERLEALVRLEVTKRLGIPTTGEVKAEPLSPSGEGRQ